MRSADSTGPGVRYYCVCKCKMHRDSRREQFRVPDRANNRIAVRPLDLSPATRTREYDVGARVVSSLSFFVAAPMSGAQRSDK